MTRQDESGQLTVMIVGFVLVAFAAAGLAVDGTRAFILRRSLQATADSAASAGAATLDRSALYRDRLAIDANSAESVALAMLEQRALPPRTKVAIDVSAEEVQLRLRSEMPTSFLGLVGLDVVPVAVIAEAEPFASD